RSCYSSSRCETGAIFGVKQDCEPRTWHACRSCGKRTGGHRRSRSRNNYLNAASRRRGNCSNPIARFDRVSIVDANGEVVGIVISGGDKATARPAKSVGSLLDRITADAKPRWPETAQTVSTRTPVPRPTPKPRLVYAPAPAFPRDAHVRPGVAWSGR